LYNKLYDDNDDIVAVFILLHLPLNLEGVSEMFGGEPARGSVASAMSSTVGSARSASHRQIWVRFRGILKQSEARNIGLEEFMKFVVYRRRIYLDFGQRTANAL